VVSVKIFPENLIHLVHELPDGLLLQDVAVGYVLTSFNKSAGQLSIAM
jgi:hypothetical protein